MFIHYLKIAFRSFWSNKLYTFLALFGISFTLMVLLLVVAYFNTELSSTGPLVNRSEVLIYPRIGMENVRKDTIPLHDLNDTEYPREGVDFRIEEVTEYMSLSAFSSRLINQHLREVPSGKTLSLVSPYHTSDVYPANDMLKMSIVYVDGVFGEIFPLDMVEGRMIRAQDEDQSLYSIVLTEEMARSYFGALESYLGAEVDINGQNYEVVGVCQPVGITSDYLNADAFIPLHIIAGNVSEDDFFFGQYHLIYRSAAPEELRKEIEQIASLIPLDDSDFNKLTLAGYSFNQLLARNVVFELDPAKGLRKLTMYVLIILGLFISLPALNLMNLNISHMMDRAAEISIRKAFGAENRHIIVQLLYEHTLLTLIGGAIALMAALGLSMLINHYAWLGAIRLRIDLLFLLWSLPVILLFAGISGIVPAYRVTQKNIIEGLKN